MAIEPGTRAFCAEKPAPLDGSLQQDHVWGVSLLPDQKEIARAIAKATAGRNRPSAVERHRIQRAHTTRGRTRLSLSGADGNDLEILGLDRGRAVIRLVVCRPQ